LLIPPLKVLIVVQPFVFILVNVVLAQRITGAVRHLLDHNHVRLLQYRLLITFVVSFRGRQLRSFRFWNVVVLMLLFIRPLETGEARADEVAHFLDR